ncbi:nucleotidyltransferase family protein [Paenibacillus sp. KS-LC4]|uniref:nucleotidyltransferase family protein n=1 Tax=Paenibacillus sp. KS-LC4 TaxID=2979727 RepID=UPI0030CC4823
MRIYVRYWGATSLGVALDASGELQLAAPCGVADVLQAALRPTAFDEPGSEHYRIYEQKMRKKNWQAIWPKVHQAEQQE